LLLVAVVGVLRSEPAPSYLWYNKPSTSSGASASTSSLALDKERGLFVAGYFGGSLTLGTNALTSSSTNGWPFEAFVARCTGAGDFLWVRQVGVGVRGELTVLASDSASNAVVCGLFYGVASFGTTNLTVATNSEPTLFLAKYSASGELIWAKTAGVFSPQAIYADHLTPIALDKADNIYLAGHFVERIYLGSTNLVSSGSADGFLAKFDSNGTPLWAQGLGGFGSDRCWGVAVDSTGNPLVTGSFVHQMGIGATHLAGGLWSDVFLAKFDPDGRLLWARQAGGAGDDQATAIALDPFDNAIITGEFVDNIGDGTANFGGVILTNSAHGAGDDFVVKYDPSGNVTWAKQIAGKKETSPIGLAMDGDGSCYVLGSIDGTVSIFGVATLYPAYPSYYVAKFRNDGSPVWAFQGRDETFTKGFAIAADDSGSAYIGGHSIPTLFFGKLAKDHRSSPPAIIQQPSTNLLVHSGGRATFSVAATGAEPTTYQWQLNGTNIAAATNSSFTIDRVTVESTGNYSVILSNSFGSVISSNGALVVAPPTTVPDFVWARRGGGHGWDVGTSVAVDDAGNIYATGFYDFWAEFDGSWLASRSGGGSVMDPDMFLAKYDRNGQLLWIRDGGSEEDDEGRGVAVDGQGNVYVTGYAGSLGTTVQIGETNLLGASGFTAKFDPDGTLLWAMPTGGNAIALDETGHLLLGRRVEQRSDYRRRHNTDKSRRVRGEV
jgi:hypothetical protein